MPVSVIIAVWNGAPYLSEAIDSVLSQVPAPLELIVVDDGSTDATPQILSRYGDAIRTLCQPNSGQAAALLAGIAVANGDLLAFNDADDIWVPGRLALQLDALAADPALDAVFGWSEQFVSPELSSADRQRLTPPQTMLAGETAQCMLVRRTSLERIGPFDATLLATSFFDWLGRAKTAGFKSLMLPDIVHRRRLHLTNYGRVNTAVRDERLLHALRLQITRRREPG